MREAVAVWCCAVLAVTFLGCGGGEAEKSPSPVASTGSEAARERLSVYVVNYPLAYFAERIGGAAVEVVFPAPAGEDPAYWSPDVEIVARYQQADLILLNGAGYAKWVEKVSLPMSKMIDTSAAFTDRLLPLDEAVTHAHGPGGEHEHTGYAFTTWLDPELAIEQARSVAGALAAARPSGATAFQEALAALEADLRTLDARLSAATAETATEPLLFSHPVYQYLIARFDLSARSVHWEPDEAPGASAWLDLGKTLVEHRAAWMIWEAEPLSKIAGRLQELGLESVVFDPCGNVPDSGDFLTVMNANAAALEHLATVLE